MRRSWLHPDRTALRDHDHRRARLAAACRPCRAPRGRPACPVREQPQADRPGPAQLPRPGGLVPDGGRRRAVRPAPAVSRGMNLGVLVALLPDLDQAPLYNAFNLAWGCEDDPASPAYQVQRTAQTAQVATFLCPSDPNAGRPNHNGTTNTNNYHGEPRDHHQPDRERRRRPQPGRLADHRPLRVPAVLRGPGLLRRPEPHDRLRRRHGGRRLPRRKNVGLSGVAIPASALLYDASSDPAATSAGDRPMRRRLGRRRGQHDRRLAGGQLRPRLPRALAVQHGRDAQRESGRMDPLPRRHAALHGGLLQRRQRPPRRRQRPDGGRERPLRQGRGGPASGGPWGPGPAARSSTTTASGASSWRRAHRMEKKGKGQRGILPAGWRRGDAWR